jgi:hypothetical protein
LVVAVADLDCAILGIVGSIEGTTDTIQGVLAVIGGVGILGVTGLGHVFDTVRLVNDDVLERKLFEYRFLNQAHFVGGDANFKVLWQQSVGNDFGSFVFRAGEGDDIKVGCPSREFASPILEGGFGNDDEMWARNIAIMFEIR